MLVAGSIDTWDPQLMYVGPEAFFAQRTFARGLTAYGTGERQRDLQGDLATDTGRASKDSRSWSFTLREGVTWQDGSPITCEDVRHGVARTFDRSTHIGGTNYATYLLDVPTKVTPEGLEKPVYAGPADTSHQRDFDRAVSCKGAHHHLPAARARARLPARRGAAGVRAAQGRGRQGWRQGATGRRQGRGTSS